MMPQIFSISQRRIKPWQGCFYHLEKASVLEAPITGGHGGGGCCTVAHAAEEGNSLDPLDEAGLFAMEDLPADWQSSTSE
jgi:hypothetical protein